MFGFGDVHQGSSVPCTMSTGGSADHRLGNGGAVVGPKKSTTPRSVTPTGSAIAVFSGKYSPSENPRIPSGAAAHRGSRVMNASAIATYDRPGRQIFRKDAEDAEDAEDADTGWRLRQLCRWRQGHPRTPRCRRGTPAARRRYRAAREPRRVHRRWQAKKHIHGDRLPVARECLALDGHPAPHAVGVRLRWLERFTTETGPTSTVAGSGHRGASRTPIVPATLTLTSLR
jgi:hypothetical protein